MERLFLKTVYLKDGEVIGESIPNTIKILKRGIAYPVHYHLTDRHANDYICNERILKIKYVSINKIYNFNH